MNFFYCRLGQLRNGIRINIKAPVRGAKWEFAVRVVTLHVFISSFRVVNSAEVALFDEESVMVYENK